MDTVLVIDADPVERNLVARYLTEAGYSVLEAANSAEAISVATFFESEIHLAVIPNPEVIDIAADIAAIRTNVPILVASDSTNAYVSSLPATANLVYLQRPLIPVVLLDKVRGLLTRM